MDPTLELTKVSPELSEEMKQALNLLAQKYMEPRDSSQGKLEATYPYRSPDNLPSPSNRRVSVSEKYAHFRRSSVTKNN